MSNNEQGRKALDLFGEMLMRKVRDSQIRSWDELLMGEIRYRVYKPIYQRLSESLGPEQLVAVRDLIPYVVDNVVAHTLGMLEEADEINVSFQVDGQTVPSLRQVADGLEAELYSVDGWIARFSRERYDPIGLEQN